MILLKDLGGEGPIAISRYTELLDLAYGRDKVSAVASVPLAHSCLGSLSMSCSDVLSHFFIEDLLQNCLNGASDSVSDGKACRLS